MSRSLSRGWRAGLGVLCAIALLALGPVGGAAAGGAAAGHASSSASSASRSSSSGSASATSGSASSTSGSATSGLDGPSESFIVEVPEGPGAASTIGIDVDLYLPDSPDPAPAVLLAHGFGASKDALAADAERLRADGYVVLA